MSKKLVTPAVRFKRNSLALMGLFHEFFESSDKSIDMKNFGLAYTYVDVTKPEQLIVPFIINTSIHWPKLLGRDNKYLIDNIMSLTADRHRKKLKPYFDLTRDSEGKLLLAETDASRAWDYVHNMVKCSVHFLYDERKEDIVTKSADLRSNDPIELSQLWGVDLKKEVYESESDSDSSDGSSSE